MMNIYFLKMIVLSGLMLLFLGLLSGFSQDMSTCGSVTCERLNHKGSIIGEEPILKAQVTDFFTHLFDTSLWPPRWQCGTWSDFHGWFYILSDVGIWAAYFAIPVILGFFLYRKRNAGLPFPGVFLLFIAFILACGLTHLVDAVIFWVPIYKFSAFIRFITAGVSIGTVFALLKIAPKVMEFRSPEHLELLVEERTKALEETNLNLAHEIKEKEEARAESKQLLESLPLIAWVANIRGNITYVNTRWKEYTGITEYDENAFHNVLHPDEREIIWHNWSNAIRSGADYIQEQRFRSAEGMYQWFLVKAIPIRDEVGNIIKWIGTSTNIEEQKRNEQRRDTFLNIASHELKTPLTAVMAYLELLREAFEESKHEPIPAYLEKATNSTFKIKNLIAELLDVSRIQSGKMDLKKQIFDLDEVIKEVVEIYRHKSGGHKITLEGHLDKQIYGDRARIEQVLNNLISNAVKYSPKGSDIIVNILCTDDHMKVDVQDFGIGISKEEQGKLFQQFYRSERAARSVDGLGMGLYISQEIAKAHGGRIEVESSEEGGSTFSLILPAECFS